MVIQEFDPRIHHRRSIRLKGYEYNQAGAYFVTLVTRGRECLFGEIRSGEMHLNPFGFAVENEWRRLGERFARVEVDDFVVMPNHLHGILVIVAEEDGIVRACDVGARQGDSIPPGNPSLASPLRESDTLPRGVTEPTGTVGARQGDSGQSGNHSFASPLQGSSIQGSPRLAPGSLGAIVGAYKSTTARLINGLRRTPGAPVWQRNFYEHILRDEREWDAIRAYILNNPFGWELDNENPFRSEITE